jgi:hypothetical protein
MEASFFIDEDALRRIQPDARPDASGGDVPVNVEIGGQALLTLSL